MQISDADIDFLHTCVHKEYKKTLSSKAGKDLCKKSGIGPHFVRKKPGTFCSTNYRINNI